MFRLPRIFCEKGDFPEFLRVRWDEDTQTLSQKKSNPKRSLELVPRLLGGGYDPESVDRRRTWVEEQAGFKVPLVGSHDFAGLSMQGNIENLIGAAQIPLGIAGPLLIDGTDARGTFYVPMATTEGALVRSYERGMATLTRAGGVKTRIHTDENRVSPVFLFDDIAAAADFAATLDEKLEPIRAEAESSTRHGKLLRLECHPIGRQVIVSLCFSTGDAHGMNMIVQATDRACGWIMANTLARHYHLFGGLESEKRPTALLLLGGKGKKVTAGATISSKLLKMHLHVSPTEMTDLWHHGVLGNIQAGSVGHGGQLANGIAAIFIACGQDVANVANSAVGITDFEITDKGALHVSVTMASITVATVGGGTALGTGRECLGMLGCEGTGKARKLAEIVAATLLAGEISFAAAVASGEFVAAHERYGRNRPGQST